MDRKDFAEALQTLVHEAMLQGLDAGDAYAVGREMFAPGGAASAPVSAERFLARVESLLKPKDKVTISKDDIRLMTLELITEIGTDEGDKAVRAKTKLDALRLLTQIDSGQTNEQLMHELAGILGR